MGRPEVRPAGGFCITSEESAMKQGCVLESAFGHDIQGRKTGRQGEELEARRPDQRLVLSSSLKFLRGCHHVENRRDARLSGKAGDWA